VSWSDGDFRVFEVPSGHFLSMLQVPWGEPTVSKMVAVAANGPSGLVAYADDQGRVIWAKPATALLAVRSAMMTGLGTLTALAFNPDGTRLAAGTDSGRVYIIDVAAQAVVAMPQLASGVTSLAWSPDGGNLAASGPGSLDVFLTNNFAKATSRTVGGALLALRFSADGKRLLGERLGGGFVDASLASGGYTFTPATSCSRPRFGASANRVYFSCPNGDVTVLDLGTGRFLAPISGLGQGTVSELSPDGVHVAALRLVDSSLASEHALTLYRADSGAQVAAARGNGALYSLEPSPVGSSLYVGGNNGLVSELDASTGRYLRDVVRFPAAQRMNWIGMLHASPDGSRLSIGSAGAGSVVIDPRSGQTLLQLGKDRYPRAFSKTNTLAVDYQGPGSADAFELYPAGAAAPTATLPGNWAGVFAGGGTSLYVINDGGVQRWNPATSQPTPLARVVNQNWSLALSPDERTLAVLSMPGPTLIDVTTGTEHVLGRTQRDYFGVLAWRPDGSLLAIAGDQTIDLVRPDTGAVVFSVPGYQDASWSPDGSVLYTPMQQGGVVTAWAIPSTP
jgi:WD40 repeat protein